MGSQLVPGPNLEGMARGGGSLPKRLLLKGGDDMYIQGGGMSTTPIGEKNISWPGEGVGQQARSLL